MRLPTRKAEQDRLQMETVDPHLSQRRMRQLQDELARLKAAQPAAIEALQHTASMGDFSENAAYQQAKQDLRRLNTRMMRIEEILKQAVPIAPRSHDGSVQLGSTVTVEHNGQSRVFEIVGSQEANPSRGRLSHQSPLGSLLIGCIAGEDVILSMDEKATQYHILRVE